MDLVNKRHYKLLVSIYTLGWMCSLLLQVNRMTGIPSPFSLHTNQNIIIIVAFTFLSFLRDSLNSLSCSSLTFTLSLTNKLFYYNTEEQCKILGISFFLSNFRYCTLLLRKTGHCMSQAPALTMCFSF